MIDNKLKRTIIFIIITISIISSSFIVANADTHTYTDFVLNRYEYEKIPVHDFYRIKFLKLDKTYARNEWIHQEGYNDTWGSYSIWIYFGDDCFNVDGWIKSGEKWYYSSYDHLSDYYGIITNCKIDIDGGTYYFDKDGAMLTNSWFKVDNYEFGEYKDSTWYYTGNNGKVLKNTSTPDGYIVDDTGAWIK